MDEIKKVDREYVNNVVQTTYGGDTLNEMEKLQILVHLIADKVDELVAQVNKLNQREEVKT